jgi:hypothetical protein
MTATEPFDLLFSCVTHLGTAVLPLWGVKGIEDCRCPKGKACGKNAGKHPDARLAPNGFKNATRDPAILRQWIRQTPNGNWAIRCGDPLPDGGFLGVLDEDPRNGSVESLAQLRANGREIPETVSASTGGGGAHRLLRFPRPPASRSVGPGLDLQGVGKYIAIAPSNHYSGGVYAWELGLAPGDVVIANAPEWLVEGTDEARSRPNRDGEDSARDTVLGEAFALAGRAGAVQPDGTMFVNCVQSHLHSDARGRGEDASTLILPPAGGSRFGGYKCLHGHCANLKWKEVLAMLPPEAVAAAQQKYPPVPREPDARAEKETGIAAPGRGLDAWKQKLHYKTDKNGHRIVNDEINANVILTYDPRWEGKIVWDSFNSRRRCFDPPWHPDDAPLMPSEEWTASDTTRLNNWFRRYWGLELTDEKIDKQVMLIARKNEHHPLQNYLNALQWDGIKRIDSWLSMYLGVEDTQYTRTVGRKWLIQAVARGFDPGCQAHHVLILEGPQGKGKSTALRSLVPHTQWFSDTPKPIGDKDGYVALRGRWIIEWPELASLRKADLEKVKAYITSPVDSYRPPYAMDEEQFPRTVVFAGSVNLGEYLDDSTGARRFWPVRVGAIDTESIVNDRDQLWAEAVHLYNDWKARGSRLSECLWWPSSEEVPMFEGEQSEREIGHPYSEAIASWLKSDRAKQILKNRGHLLTREIAKGALDMNDRDLTRADSTAIGIIMSRDLRWRKNRISSNGVRVWGFSPPIDCHSLDQ